MARLNKTYGFKNIKYRTIGKKWEFVSPTFTLIHPARGGNQVAEAVAKQLYGALARTKGNGIDGLGKKQIRMIAPL